MRAGYFVGGLFLSTPSARRATAQNGYAVIWGKEFLSTPSARRATAGSGDRCIQLHHFYPRPPRGGRPFHGAGPHGRGDISIHALREEGDSSHKVTLPPPNVFLSTPSARRATVRKISAGVYSEISIHALREEGDAKKFSVALKSRHFYPRPPRGGRHDAPEVTPPTWIFLSTPSARRATAKTEKNISAFVSL